MTEPILKAAAVAGSTRLLSGRPAAQIRSIKPADPMPYVPQPALIGAALPVRADTEQPARELETIKEAARKQGYEAGLSEGRVAGRTQGLEEAKAAQAEQAELLSKLFKHIEKHVGEQIAGLEVIAVDIVLSACRKILGEAACHPDGVAAIVKTAVAAARRDEVTSVRLHSRTLSLLANATGTPLPPTLPLVPDDDISTGGCMVEVAGGNIDARLETQFRLLAIALSDAAKTPTGANP